MAVLISLNSFNISVAHTAIKTNAGMKQVVILGWHCRFQIQMGSLGKTLPQISFLLRSEYDEFFGSNRNEVILSMLVFLHCQQK